MKYYLTQQGREFLEEAKKIGLGRKLALTGIACLGAACPGTDKPGGSAEPSTPTIKSLLNEPGMKGKTFKGGKFGVHPGTPGHREALRKYNELERLGGRGDNR